MTFIINTIQKDKWNIIPDTNDDDVLLQSHQNIHKQHFYMVITIMDSLPKWLPILVCRRYLDTRVSPRWNHPLSL